MEIVIKELIKSISPYMPYLIIIFILTIFMKKIYKNFRGYMGEFWVRKELNKLPKEKYIILNNIMIMTSFGTHQIDHIVISKFGIFVIEVKNYYGLILGDEYKDKWIQYLGKNKYYFNNPIHQNYGHIKALEEILNIKENNFISIICISNQAKVKVKSKNVTQLDLLNNLIKSYNKEILSENINDIKLKIEEKNIKDKNIRKEHIKTIGKSIKENKIKEANMICPKCGGKLVERIGKYGKFLGCSNYPKCKYTKKI